MTVRWFAFDVLSGTVGRQLDVQEYAANDPIAGFGKGTVTVTMDAVSQGALDRLRRWTTPECSGLVALDDGGVVWCGIIRSRPWSRSKGALVLAVEQMKSWWYDTALRPGAFGTDSNGDLKVDAGYSVWAMWALAVAAGYGQGVNFLMPGYRLSGFQQGGALTYSAPYPTFTPGTTQAQRFRTWTKIGSTIDALAKQVTGVEWWVDTTVDDVAVPRKVEHIWRAGVRTTGAVVNLFSTPSRQNCDWDEWPEDATGKRTRVIALGGNKPPRQAYAIDEDPDLAENAALLREQVTGPWPTVDPGTLLDYAVGERLARGAADTVSQVTVWASSNAHSSYVTGDLVTLTVSDVWLDVEVEGARVLDRTLRGGTGKQDVAVVTIDTASGGDVDAEGVAGAG